MSSSETRIPHRRNIPKSPATESTIQDRVTDREQLEGAASPPGGRGGGGGRRGIWPVGSDSLLAETLGSAAEVIRDALPALVPWTIIFSLIFGGCCSNVGLHIGEDREVSSREASGLPASLTFRLMVDLSPEKNPVVVRGNPLPSILPTCFLITFVQFAVTASFTWPTHFSASHPPFFLRPRAIPMVRWLPSIALFFIVNMLNNFAFDYNISVPVHIILRSGGSLMSMLVGYAWGKRYSNMQIFSVGMLTAGIITAAMADAQSKGKTTSSTSIDYSFITGLVILALAQLLSAIMGLYTQLTYASYGSHWHENLFYSHFLSLPLFLPFFPSLLSKLDNLFTSAPISVFSTAAPPNANLLASPSSGSLSFISNSSKVITNTTTITSFLPKINISVPSQLLNLAANALTQYICIRGVNLLSARTSALGVTIALNVRKLISLFLSIWLFGNELPPGVLVGAAIVFGSAGVWAVEGQRLNNGGDGVKDKDKDSDLGAGSGTCGCGEKGTKEKHGLVKGKRVDELETLKK